MKLKPDPMLPLQRLRAWTRFTTAAALGLAASTLSAAAPSSQPDHDAYYPGEPIVVSFADGPGNSKDWIGIYPTEAVPGPIPSTIWNYVDGTQTGATGLKEGAVTFPNGLALAGDWVAYLLLNDGYTTLTTNTFRVVDPGTPLVRVGQRAYVTGQNISITFTNGPGNAKDWVGVYMEGQIPGGGVNSTIWSYVDSTQTGTEGRTDGVLNFPAGLPEAGSYVVHFLLDDGYDILASETFSVVVPSGAGPRLLSSSPSDGSSNQPPVLRFSASITNGSTAVVTASVELRLDGAVVPAVVSQTDGLTTVTYTDAALPAVGSTHTWSLFARDSQVPPNEVRTEIRTTIGQYRNIVLPAPLHFENFDTVAEGGLPTGWTGKSYTELTNPDEDLENLDSATYGRWTVVAAQRFQTAFVTYSDPEALSSDYTRVLRPNPFNVLNGQVYHGPLTTGRLLFANSGYRNGRSQVLYVTTPDYDLTGKTNVHLGLKSLWEQNQDSIATIEYSIDQGANWLPAAYFINRTQIVTVTNETSGEVSIDVETTLGTEYNGIARYTDDDGNEIGGTYGAFIGAPISPALAPFIQGRIDDDASDSKRIELLPLAGADNQSKVRIRLGHAGTDSWYFGVDDFGIYAISSTPAAPASLTFQRTGGELTLGWPAGMAGAVLESSPTLQPASWSPVTGVTGNSHRVTPGGAAGFYRLRQ